MGQCSCASGTFQEVKDIGQDKSGKLMWERKDDKELFCCDIIVRHLVAVKSSWKFLLSKSNITF